MFGASRVDTWNGALEVSNVVIDGEETITGVLYKPKTIQSQAPGVVLAHGISNSKEPQTGLALELAKHGYVTLSIDLVGHGRSSGTLDAGDQSLGMLQAAEYLAGLPYVSSVGLVGHSLGAGVALYTSQHISESGVVLIAGGINQGDSLAQPDNLLVIVGEYDALFNMETLDERLEAAFPQNTPELNKVKGDPDQGTMTLLLTPPTSHLLEPVEPRVVKATVDWFNRVNGIETSYAQSYLIREALILLALLSFIAAILMGLTSSETCPQSGFEWRLGAVYGVVGFVSFLPSMLLGNFLPLPPQVFGSSIAWWLLVWGVVMYLLSRYWRKDESTQLINLQDIKIALAFFFACYAFCSGLEYFFGFGYRMLVPVMRSLTIRRILALILYLPFMLGHFYSESVWFKGQVGNLKGLAVSKLGLFTAVILIQYGGFYLLDTVLISGFIGFILEFLVAIVPMLLISAVITYWCKRNNRLAVSIILNALLFSWIAAGLFPY